MTKPTKYHLQQYVAEGIGTFFLVFFGCGGVILNQLNGSVPALAIPFIFGGTVAIMIYAVGHISGAHFNPAVTIAFCIARKFPIRRVLGYVIFQFLGAIIASKLHSLLLSNHGHDFGITSLNSSLLSLSSGIGIEFILSFVLMFVIISVATDTRAVGELAGIAIGATVTLCAFVGGPLTGASMNPARSLAPAIVSGNMSSLWVYLIIPIIGTISGAMVYEKIKCDVKSDDTHGCC